MSSTFLLVFSNLNFDSVKQLNVKSKWIRPIIVSKHVNCSLVCGGIESLILLSSTLKLRILC